MLRTPAYALRELWRLVDALKPELPKVRQRALVIQAREDDIASLRNAQYLQRHLGGLVETLILDDSYHLVTVDQQRHVVNDRVVSFVGAVAKAASGPGASRSRPKPGHDPCRLMRGRPDGADRLRRRGAFRGRVERLLSRTTPKAGQYYRACEMQRCRVSRSLPWRCATLRGSLPPRRCSSSPTGWRRRSRAGCAALPMAIARRLPSLTEWRLLGVGSPYADRCHIALRPDLTEGQRDAALAALIRAVEAEGESRKAASDRV